jgi:hypothetical protein
MPGLRCGLFFGVCDTYSTGKGYLTRSRNELKQHYLTRYCAGTAVAIYVMTRDRFVCSRSKNSTEADERNWAG